MRLGFRPGWLLVGAIGALGCLLFGVELVAGYVRHVPSGDQAGVALGLMFLLFWLLPAATVPVLVSGEVRGPAPDQGPRPGRALSWAARLLIASGWLEVAFAALYLATELPRSAEAVRAMGPLHVVQLSGYAGLLLGAGGVWIGFASAALRPGAAAPRWLGPVLLLTASAALALIANIVPWSLQGVAPGEGPSLLLRNLAFFGIPNLLLAAFLVRRAWDLRHRGRSRVSPG